MTQLSQNLLIYLIFPIQCYKRSFKKNQQLNSKAYIRKQYVGIPIKFGISMKNDNKDKLARS